MTHDAKVYHRQAQTLQHMTWEEALELLANGRRIRRAGWRPTAGYLQRDNGDRFIRLRHGLTSGILQEDKRWSPYFEDFNADDWVDLDSVAGEIGILRAQQSNLIDKKLQLDHDYDRIQARIRALLGEGDGGSPQ
jgi:hypothetical protein